MTRPVVAIIGAGVSGTLLAIHLLRSPGVEVVLIDGTGRFGPGLAYSTTSFAHLLNVPAGRMSADPDDGEDFVRWAKQGIGDAAGFAFLARGLYGQYVADVLDREARARPERLSLIAERAISIDEEADTPRSSGAPRARVVLESSRAVLADRVVLATGNREPVIPAIEGLAGLGASGAGVDGVRPDRGRRDGGQTGRADARFINNPWDAGALSGVKPHESILVLGTGLTMIDVVLHLSASGHRGEILAVSRRGLLPQAHRPLIGPPAHLPAPDVSAWPASALGMLRGVRALVAAGEARGVDWRESITSLRAITPALWARLPERERKRFLAHVQPYWDTHRHRVAPAADGLVRRLMDRGTLRVRAARVLRVTDEADVLRVALRARGASSAEHHAAHRVINCTGPATDPLASDDPLWRSLRERGQVGRDPLGLGVLARADGVVLDANGAPSARLLAMGPLLRGVLWECTAVPEIRVEAKRLAATLAAQLGESIERVQER